MNRRALPFLVLGVAFFTIGLSNNRAFIALGIVFLAIALGQSVAGRRRR